MTTDIADRLNEKILAAAHERGEICGALAERLALERAEASVEIRRLRAARAALDDALTTVLYDLQHAGIELAPDVLKQAEEALDR